MSVGTAVESLKEHHPILVIGATNLRQVRSAVAVLEGGLDGHPVVALLGPHARVPEATDRAEEVEDKIQVLRHGSQGQASAVGMWWGLLRSRLSGVVVLCQPRSKLLSIAKLAYALSLLPRWVAIDNTMGAKVIRRLSIGSLWARGSRRVLRIFGQLFSLDFLKALFAGLLLLVSILDPANLLRLVTAVGRFLLHLPAAVGRGYVLALRQLVDRQRDVVTLLHPRLRVFRLLGLGVLLAVCCLFSIGLLLVSYPLLLALRFLRPPVTRPGQKPVRVLCVSHEAALNGAPLSLYYLLKGLPRDRYEPILACPVRGPLTRRVRRLGIRIEQLPVSQLLSQQFFLHQELFFLAQSICVLPFVLGYLVVARIGLVHTNVMVVPEAAFAARLLFLRHVWHFRETLHTGFWARLQRRTVRTLASQIVCTSQYGQGALMEQHQTPPVAVIPNALDDGELLRSAEKDGGGRSLRQELGIDDSTRIVGVIGQITPDKGQHVFLEAAVLLHRRLQQLNQDICFVLVGITGNTVYIDRLRKIASDGGLRPDQVRFLGIRPDIGRILHGLDVVVVPSVWQEVFGRVAIEAMALHRPVVASRVGGIPEIVVDGDTGLLVEPEDAESLADAVQSILQDPQLAERLATAGRRRFEERYAVGEHAAAMVQVYDRVLA